jgi:anti-anti-sigma factor
LEIATAPQLAEMLARAEESSQRVVLDLRQVTFIDSAGVQVIINANVRASAAGRRLVLVRGPSQVDRVLVGHPKVLSTLGTVPTSVVRLKVGSEPGRSWGS